MKYLGLFWRRRYRYYMSEQSRWAARQGLKRYRSRADELEQLVLAAVTRCLEDREEVRRALLLLGRRGRSLDHIATRMRQARYNTSSAPLEHRREIVVALIARGELSREDLKLVLRCSEIENFLQWDGKGIFRANKAMWSDVDPTVLINVPVSAVRFKRSLVIPLEPVDPSQPRRHDENLMAAIAMPDEARQCSTRSATNPSRTSRADSIGSRASLLASVDRRAKRPPLWG